MNCNDKNKAINCNDKSAILETYPREARLITFGAPAYRKTPLPTTLKGVRFWNREDAVPLLGLWQDSNKPFSEWLERKGVPNWLADRIVATVKAVGKDGLFTQYHHPTVMAVGGDGAQ